MPSMATDARSCRVEGGYARPVMPLLDRRPSVTEPAAGLVLLLSERPDLSDCFAQRATKKGSRSPCPQRTKHVVCVAVSPERRSETYSHEGYPGQQVCPQLIAHLLPIRYSTM